MAKFCGKCGNPLNDYGYCPNCNPVQDNAGQWAQPFIPGQPEYFDRSPVYEPGPAQVSYPPQKPKLTKKEKKALKKKAAAANNQVYFSNNFYN